jgi:methionyl-tRNA formyltransferase
VALSVVFMGTPEFSVPTLRALHESGHAVAAVYTQPPRPGGRRGLELRPSPVQREAERLGLFVRAPLSLRGEEDKAAFAALEADVAVVVAYGLLLPQAVLDAPRLGCLNGHASLLPRWRGAAPIQRAVMAGDPETGMMVMRMEAGLDTGPVGLRAALRIGPLETAGDLHDRLAPLCAALAAEALRKLEAGTLSFTPQAETGVLYASKITKEEARIDWRETAEAVHNRIRGLSPFPGAWCEFAAGGKAERLKLLRSRPARGGEAAAPGTLLAGGLVVACGDGAVELTEVQRAGGRATGPEEFLRGARLRPGDALG